MSSDWVILDMDGPGLIQNLQARDPCVNVIAMSGLAELCRSPDIAGRQDVPLLQKPIAPEELMARVQEQVGQTRTPALR